MATWTNIKLTTEGQTMHARALANQTKLQILKVVGATGTVSGPTATDLSGRKIEADLISVAQDETNCVVKFQFSNNDLVEDIVIKEIGFFVRDDFGKTVLFSYMTDSTPETLPRGRDGEDEVVFEYFSAFGYADSANVILRPTINNGVNEETVRTIVKNALNNDERINNLNYLPLSGGTVTGDTTFRGNIIANSLKLINRDKEATVNITEDNRLQIGNSRLDSILFNSANPPKWSNGNKSISLATQDDLTALTSENNNRYVSKSGDTVSGDISFNEGNKVIFKNATNGIQLNINGDTNNRAFIRQGGSQERGYNLDVGGANIKAVSLVSKDRPIWYRPASTEQNWLPEASGNGTTWKHEPVALVSDLNEVKLKMSSFNNLTRTHHRTRPEIVPLIDWDRMAQENEGTKRNLLTARLWNSNDLYAYEGESSTLQGKYGNNDGIILLKEDFTNFDDILIHYCADDGSDPAFNLIPTWQLDFALSIASPFNLSAGEAAARWIIMPRMKLKNLPNNLPSTNTMFVATWQNSAMVEIYGIRYSQLQ